MPLFPSTQGLALQATTGLSGFVPQNAMPTILSWTAPNDGQLHRVLLMAGLTVASAQTGGAIGLMLNFPSSGGTLTIYPGAQGVGIHTASSFFLPVAAGSTVTLAQTSAQTAGTATLWAELWGA